MSVEWTAALACALVWAGLLSFHAGTIVAAIAQPLVVRLRGRASHAPPVRAIVPMCGPEPELEDNLVALLAQDYPDLRVDFCFADENDAAVAVARAATARAGGRAPRFRFGETPGPKNAKARNEYRALAEAETPFVFVMDSNVRLAPGALARQMRFMGPGAGIVSMLPIGVRAGNLVARLDCAFLNGYNARFHLAMSAVGLPIGVGKAMLVRWTADMRRLTFQNFEDLYSEDRSFIFAAQRLKLGVVLPDLNVDHPVGAPDWRQFWGRYARWARYRRLYLSWNIPVEAATSAAATALLALPAAPALHVHPAAAVVATLALRHACEAMLFLAKGWPLRIGDPLLWLVRDALLPAMWLRGYLDRPVRWKGAAFSVGPARGDRRS